jgi:hypothetical protein
MMTIRGTLSDVLENREVTRCGLCGEVSKADYCQRCDIETSDGPFYSGVKSAGDAVKSVNCDLSGFSGQDISILGQDNSILEQYNSKSAAPPPAPAPGSAAPASSARGVVCPECSSATVLTAAYRGPHLCYNCDKVFDVGAARSHSS